MRAAIIGMGDISRMYLKNLIRVFRDVEVVGVCNRTRTRAEQAAAYVREQQSLGCACPDPRIYGDMWEVFADPQVEVVLNLTRPAEHYAITKEALLHGKHVYSEKPFALTMEEADELIALAQERGLCRGRAPDTVLGAGIQTCRRLIETDMIGEIVGASCAMICHGHENWHPSPAFLYQKGAGPMMDMGPYYITALVELLGEARAVSAMTKRSFAERVIGSTPHFGEKIRVEADTWLSGNILFANGAIAQVLTTFDVHYDRYAQARFEIYGTKGTLVVPDPNTFGGPVLLYRPEDQKAEPAVDPALEKVRPESAYSSYKEIPLLFDYRENSRGLGLADMCRAIETGRPFRTDARRQRHVLEIMTAFSKSGESGQQIALQTRDYPVKAMKNGLLHGVLD